MADRHTHIAVDRAAATVPAGEDTLGVDRTTAGGLAAPVSHVVRGTRLGGLRKGEQPGEGDEGDCEEFFHIVGGLLLLPDEVFRASCRKYDPPKRRKEGVKPSFRKMTPVLVMASAIGNPGWNTRGSSLCWSSLGLKTCSRTSLAASNRNAHGSSGGNCDSNTANGWSVRNDAEPGRWRTDRSVDGSSHSR